MKEVLQSLNLQVGVGARDKKALTLVRLNGCPLGQGSQVNDDWQSARFFSPKDMQVPDFTVKVSTKMLKWIEYTTGSQGSRWSTD